MAQIRYYNLLLRELTQRESAVSEVISKISSLVDSSLNEIESIAAATQQQAATMEQKNRCVYSPYSGT
jgi:methyl-accepting chemotaxis protein